ncbi:unnamed protein product [Phytophthora fragariaefolia]|uniref:ATP-dependent DNA helicase n=1 Tax=Phytophthora fragariaefolia TaxID=1490495 RepID=A0A9W7D393_9STRA|nr:unnamed protein product [Phytophthora fragariaefolia]
MMKCTTKDQQNLEHPLAIHIHAYNKASLKAAEAVDKAVRGRHFVQSMCCSMSNAQEVSALLAALYLERKSPFYCSHFFHNVFLPSYVATLFANAEIDVVFAPEMSSSRLNPLDALSDGEDDLDSSQCPAISSDDEDCDVADLQEDEAAPITPAISHIRMRQWSDAATHLVATSNESPSSETSPLPSMSMEELDDVIREADATFGRKTIGPIQSSVHASPSDVPTRSISGLHNLNEKQHKAFVRIGRPFLKSLLATPDSTIDQIITIIGGAPGTGKSEVIRALQSFAISSIKTAAYQGVAAEAANGQTIHKLFQWGINNTAHTKQYSPEPKEATLHLLIMDAVSTTDAKLIGMVDIALRQLKTKPNERFGGVSVVFIGDRLLDYYNH